MVELGPEKTAIFCFGMLVSFGEIPPTPLYERGAFNHWLERGPVEHTGVDTAGYELAVVSCA